MSKYISQKKAHEDRTRLREANRKLKIAKSALETIAAGFPCETPGCACCTPLTDDESWTEHCDVGNAKVAVHMMKEKRP